MKWKAENGDYLKEYNSLESTKKRRRELAKQDRQDNPEKYEGNYELYRDYYLEYMLLWRTRNPDKVRLYSSIRRARKLKAMPKWLNKEELQEMCNMYKISGQISKDTGVVHHVDHIYPLKGKDSCGLHVPWNLQVIPAKDNLKKSNKLIPHDFSA